MHTPSTVAGLKSVCGLKQGVLPVLYFCLPASALNLNKALVIIGPEKEESRPLLNLSHASTVKDPQAKDKPYISCPKRMEVIDVD